MWKPYSADFVAYFQRIGRENSNHKLKKGMMDSQENTPGQGQVEEEQATVQAAADV